MLKDKKSKKITVAAILLVIVFCSIFLVLRENRMSEQSEQEQLLDVLIWGEKTDLFDRIFQAFEEKYPSIKVQVSFVSEDFYEDFIQEQISSEKEIADVMFLKPEYDVFLSLENRGRLTDLAGETYLDNYQAEDLEIYEVNKRQCGIPFVSNQLVACYNLSVLEKLNQSIPQNAEDTETLFQEALKNGITPIVFGGENERGFYEAYMQWLMLVLNNHNQAKVFASDLQNGKVMADDPILLEYMELIQSLNRKGYFLTENLLINTAEALAAFEAEEAAVILSDVWTLYQHLGTDFGKKYVTGSLFVEEGEAKAIDSLSFILGIDSKSDAKETANLLMGFLSECVEENDIELPEGMYLLNAAMDTAYLKKEYDFEVYMDKCDWWIKDPFEDMTARLLSGQELSAVIASTEELFESLTIPTYIYVP